MTQSHLWHGVLIAALCVVLAIPAQAATNTLANDARNAIIGIVAVTAAIIVITAVIVHESRKTRTITGCVTSGANGLSVTDEKNKKPYALSGNTVNIKQGDRVTLQGKAVKPKGGAPLSWNIYVETKNFGACQP